MAYQGLCLWDVSAFLYGLRFWVTHSLRPRGAYGHHLWDRFFHERYLALLKVTVYGTFFPAMALRTLVTGRFYASSHLWSTSMGSKVGFLPHLALPMGDLLP